MVSSLFKTRTNTERLLIECPWLWAIRNYWHPDDKVTVRTLDLTGMGRIQSEETIWWGVYRHVSVNSLQVVRYERTPNRCPIGTIGLSLPIQCFRLAFLVADERLGEIIIYRAHKKYPNLSRLCHEFRELVESARCC